MRFHHNLSHGFYRVMSVKFLFCGVLSFYFFFAILFLPFPLSFFLSEGRTFVCSSEDETRLYKKMKKRIMKNGGWRQHFQFHFFFVLFFSPSFFSFPPHFCLHFFLAKNIALLRSRLCEVSFLFLLGKENRPLGSPFGTLTDIFCVFFFFLLLFR